MLSLCGTLIRVRGRRPKIVLSNVLFQPDLPEKINSTATASTKRADDQGFHGLSVAAKLRLDIRDHCILVWIGLKLTQFLTCALRSKCKCARCGTCKAGMEAKRSHTAARVVVQELEIVKCSTSTMEAGENLGPTALLLVAMRELDVRVWEWLVTLGKLLQPDDRDVARRRWPGVVVDELAANTAYERR